MASTETLSKVATPPAPASRTDANHPGSAQHRMAETRSPGPLGASRITVFPRLARSQDPLQANRARSGLGHPAAGMTMVVLTIFFGRMAKVASDERIPYPVFVYAGLLPWTFFATAIANSANSIVVANLITKVYFPRLAIPVAAVLSGLVDFAIAFTFLLLMMIYYKVPLTAKILWIPFFVLLAVVTALGVGLWLSAINVKYRDVRHTIPFLTQFWMFATPIVYPASLLHEPWRTIYGLNPMVGVVEGFRWSRFDSSTRPGGVLAISTCRPSVVLVTGACYFRRMEHTFADLV